MSKFGLSIAFDKKQVCAGNKGRPNQHDARASAAYLATTQELIDAIADRLAASGGWKTNRLHGAIFGLLIGKDVTLMDNSYGKNSRYFRQWDPEAKLISAF